MTDYLGVDMSKSTKGKDPNLLTIEDAASILGVGQREIQIRFSNGSLGKRRASNGEVRVSKAEVDALAESLKPIPMLEGETGQQYAARVVGAWPAPTTEQQAVIRRYLYGIEETQESPSKPSEYELEQRRKQQEREQALCEAKKAALALTACDVCNLQPDAHWVRRGQGIDMHEWMPGRAEKIIGANRG